MEERAFIVLLPLPYAVGERVGVRGC